jgi:Ala-tRNA(Pro) deacylase
MTVPGEIKNFLDNQGMDFEIINHRETMTSGDEALAVGVVASHVAKTLVIKVHTGGDILAVVPSSARLDIHRLRDVLGDNHARLATEEEMSRDYPQFELGAVPPLGEMLGAEVFLDRRLEEANEILFAGGTHSDSIKMSGEDFLKLTHPRIADLVREPGEEEGLY